MDLALLIREIGRGATGARDMSSSEARQLYGAMLDGLVAELELGAIAIALHMKTESVNEMVGFLAAANERLPILQRPLAVPGRWSSQATTALAGVPT